MRIKTQTITIALAAFFAAACTRPAEVRLPGLFSDHAVIQRGRDVKIWGDSKPQATVKVEWRGHPYTTKAGSDGRWQVSVPSGEAGGPFMLKAGDKTVEDIMVGDVYLCSGQSNMELPVRRCLDVVADEIKNFSDRDIRYMAIPYSYDFHGPLEELPPSRWEVLDSDSTALEWSALCYFTARSLHDKTGVPVGMVRPAVGGSPIEAWMREEILPEHARQTLAPLKDDSFRDSLRRASAQVYSEWWETFSKQPAQREKWSKADLFSRSWATDSSGKNWYGGHLFRRHLPLDAKQAGADAILHLGAIVDADSVFVNGHSAGTTSYRYPPRNYRIPKEMLKTGDNLIEIHLYSFGVDSEARFIPGKRYSLETAGGDISLLDGWEHSHSVRMPARRKEIFLQYMPSGLYNGMIAPLLKYSFDGVIWYQGESNEGNAAQYGELLESMISDWREQFGDSELPFYIVELASYLHSGRKGPEHGWNRVQAEQRRTAGKMRGTVLVPNSDLGEWNDIHPQDKKTLGERTAAAIIKNNKTKTR